MPDLIPESYRLTPENEPKGVVVLFHGMTGTADDLLELGEALQKKNYACFLPLLTGHGTTISEFKRTSVHAWLNDARAALHAALQLNKPIHLVGLSFGAVLVLYLACNNKDKIKSISLLSPALSLRSWAKTWALRLLSYLPDRLLNNLPLVPKHQRANYCLYITRATYPVYSVGAAIRLFKVVRHVARKIHKISIPGLVCFDHNDMLVDVRVVMHFLKRKLPSKLFKFREYRDAGHELMHSRQAKAIINEVVSFIDSH